MSYAYSPRELLIARRSGRALVRGFDRVGAVTLADAVREWLPAAVMWGGVGIGVLLALTGHLVLGGAVAVGALALGWLWDSRSVFI